MNFRICMIILPAMLLASACRHNGAGDAPEEKAFAITDTMMRRIGFDTVINGEGQG